jgi:hypothetical protein
MTRARLACFLVDMDQKPSHGSHVVADGDKDLRKQTTHSADTNSAVRHAPPLTCQYLYAPVVLR